MTAIALWFVVLFGVLIVVSCVWALIRPQWLFDFAKPFLGQGWLMIAAVGIRIALGAALLLIAEQSAFPLAFRILGSVAIFVAVVLPFVGMARVKRLIDWMETLPEFAVRLWIVVGIALGALLLYGVHPVFG